MQSSVLNSYFVQSPSVSFSSKGTPIYLSRLSSDNISIKSHLSDWAHTKTDVMLEVVEDKLLFTGDTVNNKRIVPFDGGSFKGSIASINNAIKLGVKVVVPGHGATTNGDILAIYKAGLESIYQTTKTLVEDDMEAYEMKDKAIASNKAFKNWDGLEDEIGRYLSLAVQEIEQEDFQ